MKTFNIINKSILFLTLSIFLLNINKLDNKVNKNIKINSEINKVQIHLNKEREFKPLNHSLNWTRHEIDGVIADNDSRYNDGATKWTSFYEENNGVFEFDLSHIFKSVSIDEKIKVSGLYDQYYSEWAIVPVGADTLVRSQEIFNLKGTALKGGPEVLVGSGSVAIIIDRWGQDNFGYSNVNWYMSLNNLGNRLTLRCEGYETGNIWATASPIWTISEITTADKNDSEFHDKEGSGITYFSNYAFQTPEDYNDNYLNVVGEI